LVPPSHDLTAALKLSTSFLQAQRATSAEALAGYSGVLPPDSILNLKDTALTQEALTAYPWLMFGPTDSPLDPVKVSRRGIVLKWNLDRSTSEGMSALERANATVTN
jgi:hypothetical protein